MPRSPRVTAGKQIYHVMNRGNGRLSIFDDDEDFEAFERVLLEGLHRFSDIGLMSYCVMPNHWHLLLYPTKDKVISRFVAWVTLTHTTRWQKHRDVVGEGHLYQGRFRSFIVQPGSHFVRVCRYIERNPLRANFVKRAEDWKFSSLWRWHHGTPSQKTMLHPWPDPPKRRPPGWLELVNTPLDEKELEAIRLCQRRDRPYGVGAWRDVIIKQYGLESTLRPRGRPRKAGN